MCFLSDVPSLQSVGLEMFDICVLQTLLPKPRAYLRSHTDDLMNPSQYKFRSTLYYGNIARMMAVSLQYSQNAKYVHAQTPNIWNSLSYVLRIMSGLYGITDCFVLILINAHISI